MSSASAHPLDTGTRLAVERTRLAHERTLMAWVRTAVSLISFGFTIYKFFEFEAGRGGPAANTHFTPRQFGMIMIGTGLAALVLGAIDHRRSMKQLGIEYGQGPSSVALVIAGIVSVMGLLAFGAVLLRG